MTRELVAEVTLDNTDGLRRVVVPPYNRARTVNLRFIELPGEGGFLVQAWGAAFPDDGGGGYQGHLHRSAGVLNSSIDVLREAWLHHVVRHEERSDTGPRRHPFADGWNLSGRPELLRRVGPALAQAGHSTYRLLFGGTDPGLRRIRALLETALAEGENVISIESDSLLVPWGMLYAAPERPDEFPAGERWSVAGFWGYRHVIEHTFTRVDDFDARITVAGGKVVVGLNVDRGVDLQFPETPYIAPVKAFFQGRAEVVLREDKQTLLAHFRSKAFSDHVTYFGCHGKVSGSDGRVEHPYLILGDGQRIYGADLEAWLADAPLPTQPFVYVGACQGGQVCSAFYAGFGKVLLGNGGRCLIGPQIDLPPAFACEYSHRLFSAFLDSGAKLGDIVRSLARVFVDEHANPLGLMFSLYRGIDVHLWQAGRP
ncbi:hypothetical protein ILP97_05835 [Amycolatopsis sp. H6(2020)]|nr:hypothetical protein [Amycolatopsis sp. H6(2020)]